MSTQSSESVEFARERLIAGLPVTEHVVTCAGVRTPFLQGGEGESIVLLHGPGESSLWWMRVIPTLVETHRVIVPDLPDHGASQVIDNPLDEPSMLGWLDELIGETCAEPPVLVGHILGGALALRFSINRSTPLQRMVLVDTLGLAKFRPSPLFALGLIRFMVRPSDRAYDQFLNQCLVDRDRVIDEIGEDWDPFVTYQLATARAGPAKAAMRSLMKTIGTPVIPPSELERIDVPTALIWGRNDRANSLDIATAASERYGWPLHVIDDAGDDPKLERPAEFVRALTAILETD